MSKTVIKTAPIRHSSFSDYRSQSNHPTYLNRPNGVHMDRSDVGNSIKNFKKKTLNGVTQFVENLFSAFEIICHVESKWQREWASDDSTGHPFNYRWLHLSPSDQVMTGHCWQHFDSLQTVQRSFKLQLNVVHVRQLVALDTFVNVCLPRRWRPKQVRCCRMRWRPGTGSSRRPCSWCSTGSS